MNQQCLHMDVPGSAHSHLLRLELPEHACCQPTSTTRASPSFTTSGAQHLLKRVVLSKAVSLNTPCGGQPRPSGHPGFQRGAARPWEGWGPRGQGGACSLCRGRRPLPGAPAAPAAPAHVSSQRQSEGHAQLWMKAVSQTHEHAPLCGKMLRALAADDAAEKAP